MTAGALHWLLPGAGLVLLPFLVLPCAATEGSEGSCPVRGASCQEEVAGSQHYWPMQKGNFNRTGLSPYSMPFDLMNWPHWRFQDELNDVSQCTPLIDAKKNIYYTARSGRTYKFSPGGVKLWMHQTSRGSTGGVPALSEDSIISYTRSGFVFALDLETGSERWAVQVGSRSADDASSILVVNGSVLSATEAVPNGQGNLLVVAQALDDGRVLWTFRVTYLIYNFQASTPGDGTVVFQDAGGGLYRLRLNDGQLIWQSGAAPEKKTGFTTAGAVVTPTGLVIAASNHITGGAIHAYRLSDGYPVWWRDTFLPANQAVAVGRLAGSPRLAVVGGVGENPGLPVVMSLPEAMPGFLKLLIHRLSLLMKGWPSWLWRTHARLGSFGALEADTGEVRWQHQMRPYHRHACASDEEYIAERYSAGATDMICLPDSWAQPVIDADGTAFAGYMDGYIYSVRDDNGDGSISPDAGEVKMFDTRAAFQGSLAMAPDMLAAVPCHGGLWVWRRER